MAIVINGTGTIAGVSATGITTAPTNATDASKLPKAGGQMTGNITFSAGQTVGGRNIAMDGSQTDTNTSAIATNVSNISSLSSDLDDLDDAKLNLSGGTLTGNVSFGNNNEIRMGGDTDLKIYHDHANSQNVFLSSSIPTVLAVNDLKFANGANDTLLMIIKNDGNVGIGTTPKAWNAALTGLQIGETGAISGGNTAWGGYLEIGSNFYRDSGGYKFTTADKACLTEYNNATGDINFKTSNAAGSAGGGIAWLTQLQIKQNGEVLKGPWAANGSNTGTKFINGEIHTSYNGAAPRKQIYIYNPNGEVGSIASSFTSCNFNTSSDYRLKENVDYTWDATTKLKQLKPARFNFIAHPERTVDGFLAHEAGTVVPECVTGTHNEVDGDGNAVMQGIDQSKLVPLLVKTIQELEARITALEA